MQKSTHSYAAQRSSTTPQTKQAALIKRFVAVGRQHAIGVILVGMASSMIDKTRAQTQEQEEQILPQNVREFFPGVSEKASVTAFAARGTRSLLNFVEHLFAVVVPETLLFVLVLGVGIFLAWAVPILISETVQKFGASRNSQNGIRFLLGMGIGVFAVKAAIEAVSAQTNIISIAAALGFFQIIVPAATLELIQNASVSWLLQFGGRYSIGGEIQVNGVHGVIEYMGITHVIVRLIEQPEILVDIPNHEAFGSKTFRYGNRVPVGWNERFPQSQTVASATRAALDAHQLGPIEEDNKRK